MPNIATAMTEKQTKKIAIIGTVGLPAAYSGFETLVENLVRFHAANQLPGQLTVYCSKSRFKTHPSEYLGAQLVYLPLNANGPSSIIYDIWSMLHAIWNRSDVLLVLGVSGALALPLLRALSNARIVTNIDGIEWKREKWQGIAKGILRISEWFAVKFSHVVVADNEGIVEHVQTTYGASSLMIAYGGDHALADATKPYDGPPLPEKYALAICRIEPENNVGMIVEAFVGNEALPLVFIGNWNNSEYGRGIRNQFMNAPGVHLLDPIYDLDTLLHIRQSANVYIHGHSAGGTNPSLVEAMHFGMPILAFDCKFNRYSTFNSALYFVHQSDLKEKIENIEKLNPDKIGKMMKILANDHYVWDKVADKYFTNILY